MSTKTQADKGRKTTLLPITTMEEVPVLSEAEQAELLASLKEAEGQIAAGEATDYDPQTFKARLLEIYRTAKR